MSTRIIGPQKKLTISLQRLIKNVQHIQIWSWYKNTCLYCYGPLIRRVITPKGHCSELGMRVISNPNPNLYVSNLYVSNICNIFLYLGFWSLM